jgi:hypothetical protein
MGAWEGGRGKGDGGCEGVDGMRGGKGRLGFENVMRVCRWVDRFEGFGGSRGGILITGMVWKSDWCLLSWFISMQRPGRT